ncbi:SCG1 protein, partial [Paradoxornis webbianus]|nr:SCG1 protein [Sinosuthora webbiana]
GAMEGKETSPSHTSESSSLDLPSGCDLAEHLLPPHSSENSQELDPSGDAFPSPPTGASTVPVEKDRTEEMVTRCIVEVLSNALSKPNAPPINPECREILRRSDKNDRERSENRQPEVRHPKEAAETQSHPAGSVEQEQRQPEEDSRKYLAGGDEDKPAGEGGKSEEEEAGQHTPAQEETLHTEDKKHYQETGREEEERDFHSEEESKEGRCCEDVEAAVVTKKSRSEGVSVEEFRAGSEQSPRGRWQLEEGIMQSPSKQSGEGEEGEEERRERYQQEARERGFSRQQEREESEESEEREERKEPYKAKGSRGKHRAGDSSEEKRGHGGDRGSQAGQASLWEQWKHHQKHQEQSEEKGGSPGRPEELQEEEERPAEQGSEEHRDSWQHSQESRESKRHQHSEERRQQQGSHRPEGRMFHDNEEELDTYLSKERQRRVGGKSHLWNKERSLKGQARRHHSTEDSLEEEEEEEVQKKHHHSSEQVEDEEEERFAERGEHRGRVPAEKEKRTAASYRPFYPLLWWKSQHPDKRDSAGEQLLEGREEGRPALAEKSLFPDYSDYEWWSEKQIQSALKHRRSDKRNPGKTNRYGVDRQYNKMDQLAQLLNYRKKSAELPELYSSGEDLKKRHVAGNDRRSLRQRPLTEEEEKQLENLATMDLELQNIAEKINSLRRG